MKKIVVFIVLLILLVNIPLISSVIDQKDIRYSNGNGTFTFDEVNFSGRDFDMCQYKFLEFKKLNKDDTVLYRLTPKHFFHFWNWGDYLFDKKYNLPYRNWKEIATRRGPITNKSGFQDF